MAGVERPAGLLVCKDPAGGHIVRAVSRADGKVGRAHHGAGDAQSRVTRNGDVPADIHLDFDPIGPWLQCQAGDPAYHHAAQPDIRADRQLIRMRHVRAYPVGCKAARSGLPPHERKEAKRQEKNSCTQSDFEAVAARHDLSNVQNNACALIQVKSLFRQSGHFQMGFGKVARMKKAVFLALLLGIVPGALARADESGPDPQLVAKCQDCHGPAGSRSTPATPRLNGQDAGYLLHRLKGFLDPTSGTAHATEHMWETATQLGDRTASELARFFAAQAPTPADPKTPLAAKGEKIYRQGIIGDVPACQSCHGQNGEARNDAPRLAGQRGDYLEEQLNAFMFQMRVSSAMNRHAWHMQPDQFRALRAYLSNDR